MSSRDRGAYSAAARAGIVVALLISGSAHSEQSSQPVRHGSAQERQSSASPVLAPIAPKPYHPSTPCGHAGSAEQENLCIEWRAAKATEAQSAWAMRTFWVGLIGTGLVLVTLFATLTATNAAQRSAKAAEEAVGKTDAVLDHAKSSSEKELRAYLGVKPIAFVQQMNTMDGGTVKAGAYLHVVNYGQTPAYDVLCTASLAMAGDADVKRSFERRIRTPVLNKTVVNPAEEREIAVPCEKVLTDAELAELTAPKGRRLYAFGVIAYKDAFEKTRKARFAFLLAGGPDARGARWFPATTHNDAT